jgi:hypothetical protein
VFTRRVSFSDDPAGVEAPKVKPLGAKDEEAGAKFVQPVVTAARRAVTLPRLPPRSDTMSDATPATTNATPEPPQNFFDKLGAALPVGLTALATIFASMSNGALQEAMYWKSQAAQDQSRATNQWTLAGFKVDRSLVVQTAAAQLAAVAGGKRIEWPADPGKPDEKQAAEWLVGKGPPGAYRRGADSKAREGRVGLPDITSAPLNELLDLIRKRAPEDEILRKSARIPMAEVTKAINDAESANEKITEVDWDPVVGAARKLVADARKADGADAPARTATAQAALFEMEQRRYRRRSTRRSGSCTKHG